MTTSPTPHASHRPLPGPAARSDNAKIGAVAAGALGIALLIAAILTSNRTLALFEAVVGVLLIASLVAGYALRRASRNHLFERVSRE